MCAVVCLQSWNTCLSACDRGGEWEASLSLLDELRVVAVDGASGGGRGSDEKARVVVPDLQSFNSALSACAGGGAWEPALSLLLEMMRAHAVAPTVTMAIDMERQRASGGGGVASSTTAAPSSPSPVSASNTTQRRVPPPPPDATSFGAVLAACGRGGAPDSAKHGGTFRIGSIGCV